MRPAPSTTALLAAAAAIAAVSLPAAAAEKVVWDWSFYGPPRGLTAGMQHAAKVVAEKSNGNFQIKLHFAEEISPAKSVLDGLKIDAFQGAMVTFSYAPGKTPLLTGLDLPYLPIGDIVAQQKVWEAYNGWEPVKKELSRWNTRMLYVATIPLYEFMGTGSAPTRLEDWKGMRVRALGPLGDAMRTLGAVPTSVPAPEVYTALERGTFQAASFPFTYSFGVYRLNEISKWYTRGMQIGAVSSIQGVSITAWNKLPAEYKKMLEDVREEQYKVQREHYEADDKKWLPIFKKSLQEVTFTPEMLAAFREKAAKPVWQKWVGDMKEKGLPGQEALDEILTAAHKASGG